MQARATRSQCVRARIKGPIKERLAFDLLASHFGVLEGDRLAKDHRTFTDFRDRQFVVNSLGRGVIAKYPVSETAYQGGRLRAEVHDEFPDRAGLRVKEGDWLDHTDVRRAE